MTQVLIRTLLASNQQVPKVVSVLRRQHHRNTIQRNLECLHRLRAESTSHKNVPTADALSRAITPWSGTSRTNTSSPIRYTSASSAIGGIAQKIHWLPIKAYSIAARAECWSDCLKRRRSRTFSAHTCRSIPGLTCLTSPPSWVSLLLAYHNKRNAINYCNYKCSIWWAPLRHDGEDVATSTDEGWRKRQFYF